jgi:hypothetical protein
MKRPDPEGRRAAVPRHPPGSGVAPGRWSALFATLLAVAMLALHGCGGGGLGSGGTGAPLALTSGTVTGFGSVIVDGVAYDDREADVQVDDPFGALRRAEARLGQQVDIEFDAQGVPRVIRVGAQLLGQVDAVLGVGRFRVLGREVVVNADPRAGPITVLDGYASLPAIAAGQWVELHGFDAADDTLQATRVQRLAAAPLFVRASGRIESLERRFDAETFRLAGGPTVIVPTVALRLPRGTDLAVGQRVTVLGPASEVRTLLGQVIVTAGLVGIRAEPGAGQVITLAGRVSGVQATSLLIGGRAVEFDPAVVEPASGLGEGVYARIEGEVLASGRLRARAIRVRSAAGAGGENVELRGNVSGLSGDGRRFAVRGVTVAMPVDVVARDCPSGQLAEGVYAEVTARLGLGTLEAREIACRTEPPGVVVTRHGVVGSVDATRRQFVLQAPAPAGPQRVEWNALTFFRDLDPTAGAFAGQAVEVDGLVRTSDGVLVARRVRPLD